MTDNEYCKHGSLICWNQCHECSDEEDEQGDKDKRIAELEAALASRNDVLNKDGVRRLSEVQVAYEQERNRLNVAQHTDRIKELEAELATRETNQSAQRGQLYLQIDDLKADNARLRKCLEWLEWVDKYTPSGRLMPFCPACGSPKATGHQVDCWLAAEIGGER